MIGCFCERSMDDNVCYNFSYQSILPNIDFNLLLFVMSTFVTESDLGKVEKLQVQFDEVTEKLRSQEELNKNWMSGTV
jgi:hypothetical protein